MVNSTDSFTSLLEHVLSKPPSQAGMRIRSYRELSAIFDLSHSQVKTTLTKLEKKGLIFRKRGSGTFVRRVPSTTSLSTLNPVTIEEIDPAKIFKDDPESVNENSAPDKNAQSKLNLGIIGVPKSPGLVVSSIIQSISNEISQRGHMLTLHYVDEKFDEDERETLRKLDDFLSRSSCEGCLVNGHYGGDALDMIKKQNVPLMYYIAGRLVVEHEPIIMMDGADAVERAVYKLAQQGYKKIALFGLEGSSGRYSRYEPQIYDWAMHRVGLDYRKIEGVQYHFLDFKNSLRAMDRIMKAEDRPEAIIVCDDNLMPGIAQYIDSYGIQPGRDLGVIAISNRGIPLPRGHEWSSFEFNPAYFGKILVDNLLWLMQRADTETENVNILARWRPGNTHIRNS